MSEVIGSTFYTGSRIRFHRQACSAILVTMCLYGDVKDLKQINLLLRVTVVFHFHRKRNIRRWFIGLEFRKVGKDLNYHLSIRCNL